MNAHAILGTDLSPASDKLLECSHEYKKLGINKITLLHALGIKHLQSFEDLFRDSAEEKLTKQKGILEKNGFEVEIKIAPGIPVQELENHAIETNAGLIIIGSHGASLTKAVLGSTASEILLNMKVPVLLVVMKGIETNEANECQLYCGKFVSHILFPTDFSDSAEYAFHWIKNRKVELPEITLMHIQDEIRIKQHMGDKLVEFNKIDTERLDRLKDSIKMVHPETKINIVLEYGKPLQNILRYIEKQEVSLTVMGSQGRGFIPEIFLGSISHQVARHSDSNVLLVPLPRG